MRRRALKMRRELRMRRGIHKLYNEEPDKSEINVYYSKLYVIIKNELSLYYKRLGIVDNLKVSYSNVEYELNNITKKLIITYKDTVFNVKTQFGIVENKLFGIDDFVLAHYILLKHFDYPDLSIKEMIETIDIGLVESKGRVYCNVDPDVAKWIHDNGNDSYLYRLACGYIESLKLIYLVNDMINKYLDLVAGFNKKVKLLEEPIDLFTELYEEFIDKDTLLLDKYLDRIDTYNKNMSRGRKIDMFDEVLNAYWVNIDKALQLINDKIEIHQDIVGLNNAIRKYNIDINNESLTDFTLTNIGWHFNVNQEALKMFLLGGYNIEEAIDKAIELRNNCGMNNCSYVESLSDLERYEDRTTKWYINNLIRQRINKV